MSQNLDQINPQITPLETVEKQKSKYCSLNLQNQSLLYNHIYNEHKFKKFIFAFFVLVIVLNFFCNLSLFIANFQTQEVIEEYFYLPFHQLDFWGAFFFALSEGCVLILTGIVTLDSYKIYLIIINIGGTLVALILFLFNPELFEPTSHWIEYSVQLLLTLTDFLFIFQQDKTSLMYKYRYSESFIIIVTFIMSLIKLLIYGDIIPTNDDGERQAHYLEYSGEMINDCFAIFFIVIQLNKENTNILQTMQTQLDKLLELNGITIRE
ncbi:unnamed protein product (macronuclear) [Paramecium tetraurelia]|uniref:Transmembrane protein n=1 Tax=Paramecium tetraurelia TaxID=5888 RepID=A0DZA4_PARTE|nr:uncharacterized protein GSPATT00003340001 [Paramecium tetraurelia]CAK88371.1 unnamed protein product [Paramecium tetraurelia]|eukprot:XP_001455768.1 hypothetical protein (macronuclear) [Paramecium tetraurelia strain d4-2]